MLSSMRRWLFGATCASRSLPCSGLAAGEPAGAGWLRIPESYPHPGSISLARALGRDPPARRARVDTGVLQRADAADPEPEIVSPLYAQPPSSFFLRIPIHVHAEGGRDRGLARRAFAREVPNRSCKAVEDRLPFSQRASAAQSRSRARAVPRWRAREGGFTRRSGNRGRARRRPSKDGSTARRNLSTLGYRGLGAILVR